MNTGAAHEDNFRLASTWKCCKKMRNDILLKKEVRPLSL